MFALIVIISPILKGVVPIIEKEAKKSSKSFCAAKATAIPQTPREANSGVIATPIVSKKIKSTIIQTTTWRIVLKISVRFFLVFASWDLEDLSRMRVRINFPKALISITRAIAKSAEKTICTRFTKGKAKEAKKSGIAICE